MLEKIICEYCNKEIIKINKNRHQNSKACKNKQQNKGVTLELKEYKCKYCKKSFTRLDKRNEHELNRSCNAVDIITILESKNEIIKQKEKDIITILESKNEIIKQKDIDINIYKEENSFLKSQLQTYRPNIYNNNNTINNITINNTISVNFDDIKSHLDKFNIHILSDHTALIHFIMNIFSNKVKLTNECKQIMSYYLNDKLINDIKCKTFLSNSAGQLTEISDKICKEGKNNKSLSDTIVKSACINNMLLNNISSEEGVKNGIRKKKPMILVHEIIRYLKDNALTEIKGV
jgi:hypothetical protein